MSEEMLTVEEIAKELRISPKTVRSWITSGELVALDIGREYRISRAHLEDFKQRRQTDRRRKTDETKKEL
jgi:nitrogen PTS system EIIA component